MLCDHCSKRNLCNTLCPEAEVCASQDWEYLQELNIGVPTYGKSWPTILRTNQAQEKSKKLYKKLSSRERQVVAILALGFSRKEIMQELGISKKNVDSVILRIKEKAKKL